MFIKLGQGFGGLFGGERCQQGQLLGHGQGFNVFSQVRRVFRMFARRALRAMEGRRGIAVGRSGHDFRICHIHL